jgi:hypothetical protein
MVQRFSKLQGIHQGLTIPVLNIKLINAFAFDQKTHDLPGIFLKPDIRQLSSLAQKKRASKNIRGLQTVWIQNAHLLPIGRAVVIRRRVLIFSGRFDRKRNGSGGANLWIASLGHQLRLAKVQRLMAFFLPKIPFLKNLSREK